MSRNSEGDGVREEFQDKVTLRLMTQESGLSRVIFGARDATFSVLKKKHKNKQTNELENTYFGLRYYFIQLWQGGKYHCFVKLLSWKSIFIQEKPLSQRLNAIECIAYGRTFFNEKLFISVLYFNF